MPSHELDSASWLAEHELSDVATTTRAAIDFNALTMRRDLAAGHAAGAAGLRHALRSLLLDCPAALAVAEAYEADARATADALRAEYRAANQVRHEAAVAAHHAAHAKLRATARPDFMEHYSDARFLAGRTV